MNELSDFTVVLSVLIAVFGFVLLCMLYSRIVNFDKELKLKRFRSKDAGLADLLNYAAVVDDGVIVCKNGAFMASWIYKGEDNANAPNEVRNRTSDFINRAFVGLGSGWMIHVDCVRRPTEPYSARELSNFPDFVSQAIDEERRKFFNNLGEMYESYFVLTLTWYPPMLAQSKFVELMFDDDSRTVINHTKRTLDLIDKFKTQINTFENSLSSALSLYRLKSFKALLENGKEVTYDDFLSWLHLSITGIHQPIILPSNPMYLDSLIGGQELFTGIVPKIGQKYIQVVALEGFPMESYPSMLSALGEVSCECRWNSRFIFLDQHVALAHLDKYRKKWKQKIRGFFDQVFNTNTGTVDQNAVAMMQDAEAAMGECQSGLVAFGYWTSVVVLMDENKERLNETAMYVHKRITELGFAARIETINTMDAFFGSLGGHGVENVRRPLISTANLADMLPTSSIWTGEDSAPCPMYPPLSPALMYCVAQGRTPFRLNLHVRDLGHTFIFGPTGAGKSTHLAILAAQFRRYQGMTIFCFDKGLSMYPLTKAVGGLHFSVASDDDSLAFCPLQFLETKGDRAWALQWIDSMLALNGLHTTPTQRNLIATALNSMLESGSTTLSEFSTTIQDNEIRDALKQYTIDGSMGYLLDAEKDGLEFSDFTTFEIEELMNLGEKYALPVLLYLFRRIEKSLTGQPAVIILDEAWLMLGHPVFREKIREWLKVLRKANCLVLMATQSLSDAKNSGILDVIAESTATKIFLPNVFARDEETAELYKRLGLNERQIEILATAVPKQQYYYVSENGRRLYDLALGKFALAFVGSTDKESIATIKLLEKMHGKDWIYSWLESKKLNYADYVRI